MGVRKLHTRDNPVIYVPNGLGRRLCLWDENGKKKRMYYSRWLWERNNGVIPGGYIIHHGYCQEYAQSH